MKRLGAHGPGDEAVAAAVAAVAGRRRADRASVRDRERAEFGGVISKTVAARSAGRQV